jgi:hypothetical protein
MATTTAIRPARQRKPRVKPERRCRLSDGLGGARRILTLFIGAEAFLYWLESVGTDWGRGFKLEKFQDGDVYHVHLDPALGPSCECKGFLKWGHCKHEAALSALVAGGKL